MTKFNLGALPSPPDDRDYSVCAIPRTYPEKFRLAMDKNYDQEYGTCVAQSARGVFRERFDIDIVDAALGNLSLLTTAEKSNLVAAISEANDRGTYPPYKYKDEKGICDEIMNDVSILL